MTLRDTDADRIRELADELYEAVERALLAGATAGELAEPLALLPEQVTERYPIGPQARNRVRWHTSLRRVQHHLAMHGETPTAKTSLGMWLTLQPRAQLTDEQRAALAEVGWLDRRHTSRHARAIEALVSYGLTYGDVTPTQGEKHEGVAVGFWVNARRREYRRDALDGWLVDLLDSMPGWQWRMPLGTRRSSRPHVDPDELRDWWERARRDLP